MAMGLPEVRAEAERAGRDAGQIAAAIVAITAASEPSSKVVMVFDLRLRAVLKQSLTISATFRNVGCSIA